MPITSQEQEQLAAIKKKLDRVKVLLGDTSLGPNTSLEDWHECLMTMKSIVGNASNDMSTIACLMVKDYLYSKLTMCPYEALGKPHGASGLDVDEQTTEGKRVIAEIKTNGAFGYTDLRSEQRKQFEKDFARLKGEQAEYKFFFVTDPEIFAIIQKKKYSAQLPGVTLVLLPAGCELYIPETANS